MSSSEILLTDLSDDAVEKQDYVVSLANLQVQPSSVLLEKLVRAKSKSYRKLKKEKDPLLKQYLQVEEHHHRNRTQMKKINGQRRVIRNQIKFLYPNDDTDIESDETDEEPKKNPLLEKRRLKMIEYKLSKKTMGKNEPEVEVEVSDDED